MKNSTIFWKNWKFVSIILMKYCLVQSFLGKISKMCYKFLDYKLSIIFKKMSKMCPIYQLLWKIMQFLDKIVKNVPYWTIFMERWQKCVQFNNFYEKLSKSVFNTSFMKNCPLFLEKYQKYDQFNNFYENFFDFLSETRSKMCTIQ